MSEQGELSEFSESEFNETVPNETVARQYLEVCRWPNGPVCPFCCKTKSVKPLGGQSMGEGWYHCRRCRQKFTVRVGTMFERSKIPLRNWLFVLAWASERDVSSIALPAYEIHKRLGITYKSARLMVERINRYTPNTGPTWWVGTK